MCSGGSQASSSKMKNFRAMRLFSEKCAKNVYFGGIPENLREFKRA